MSCLCNRFFLLNQSWAFAKLTMASLPPWGLLGSWSRKYPNLTSVFSFQKFLSVPILVICMKTKTRRKELEQDTGLRNMRPVWQWPAKEKYCDVIARRPLPGTGQIEAECEMITYESVAPSAGTPNAHNSSRRTLRAMRNVWHRQSLSGLLKIVSWRFQEKKKSKFLLGEKIYRLKAPRFINVIC